MMCCCGGLPVQSATIAGAPEGGLPFLRLTTTLLAAFAALLTLAATQSHAQSQKKPDWQGTVDYWQPQWMQRELWGPGRMPKGMQVRMLRHWTYVNHGVPKPYQNASSPVAQNKTELLAGSQLYRKHCASCHGSNGLGNGDAGKSLLPSPALLAYMIKRPISADEYLLWAISDGGVQFQTAMPAFKDKLARDDIWRIIGYMRAGFGKKTEK